jgi:hypothetical protein
VLSKVLLFTKKKRSYGILLEKQIDILQGTSIKVSKYFYFGNFFISLEISKMNGNKHQVIQKGGLHKTTKLHQLYHFQFKASIFFRAHQKNKSCKCTKVLPAMVINNNCHDKLIILELKILQVKIKNTNVMI